MGKAVENVDAIIHGQGTTFIGVRFHLHHGDLGIDSESPEIPAMEWATVRQATGSQSGFDQVMALTAAGSWYAGWAPSWKAGMRQRAIMAANGVG